MFENMFNKELKKKVDELYKELFPIDDSIFYSFSSRTSLLERLKQQEEKYSSKLNERLNTLLLHLKLEEHTKDGQIIFEPLKKKKKKKGDYCDEY